MGAPHEQPFMARATCARHKQLLACRRSGSAEMQARDACAFGLYGMCFVPEAHASFEEALVHFYGDGGPDQQGDTQLSATDRLQMACWQSY